ncbi:MAG: hypothetical protein ACE5G0_09560, partial [Rhodothermales bacterium]
MIIYLAVRILGYACNLMGLYLPLELTFLVLFTAYSTMTIFLWGQTIGKKLLGLRVAGKAPGPSGFIKIVLRETIGKPLALLTPFVAATVVFFIFQHPVLIDLLSRNVVLVLDLLLTVSTLGFLLYWQRSRPLQDRISGTEVVEAATHHPVVVGSVIGAIALLFLVSVPYIVNVYQSQALVQRMAVNGPAPENPNPTLKNVNELDADAEQEFVAWLDSTHVSPLDFAIQQARQHPLVIFGEEHLQKQSLAFLNTMIPALYDEAGVTCIAMEAYLAEANEDIADLLAAPQFDTEKALQLTRRMDSWGSWGWQGYLDVLETVWRTNQRIPPGQPKIRVVGIGLPIDAQSSAMVGIIDNPGGSHVPFWEKLRVVRLLKALPSIGSRQEFMAREVEREIFDKGEKDIVWIGAAHAVTRTPRVGFVGQGKREMGYILSRRHPGQVSQVMLHRRLSAMDPEKAAEPGLTAFIEKIMALRGHTPVGFKVLDSPFATLRDDRSLPFRDATLGLADYTPGYIYLTPLSGIEQSDWIPGYITQKMF